MKKRQNLPEQTLLTEISTLIEHARGAVVSQANYALTLLFWKIGTRVNEAVLQNFEILATLSTQLSWSHFIQLLPLKSSEAKLFYARQAVDGHLGVRDLRSLISRKAFERTAIANAQLAPNSPVPHGTPTFLIFSA